MKKRGNVDLNICKKGDILISAFGERFIYERPTTDKEYLDHIIISESNQEMKLSRTNDGYVFAKNRAPEIDHDIVEIIHKQ